MKTPFDHFGRIAPFYEKVLQPGERTDFWKLVDIHPGDSILDACGGTGRVSQQIQQLDGKIIVTDLSLPMLRQVQIKEKLIPLCALGEYLPFPDEYFERVILVDALHHVADQRKTVHELWRVLKPGGRIIIEEPDIDHIWGKLIELGEKFVLMHSHFLSGEQIVRLFSSTTGKVSIHRAGMNCTICICKPEI